MSVHIDTNDPRYRQAAAEILRRHDNGEPEANITSAVRNFLTVTGLVKDEEIAEENPPAQGSRRAVDLTALDTFIEFKRRIGTTGGFNADPDNVQQLDDYLEQSEKQGRVRMGILTDGRYWLLRWPNAGPVKAVPPYAFTLEDPDRWITLYEWLRDHALSAERNKQPSRLTIAEHFGPNSPTYQRDIATLKALYGQYAHFNTIKVKRQLWQNLLTAALGEIADNPAQMDDLFVRHTYLTAVIGIVVQASFGSDIYRLAETDPADLLHGRDFRSKTGLQGVVESDFFAWPTEVGGLPLLKTLARRVARFDWHAAPNDVAAILYETVIPPDERRQLGEYYTPDWLARTMVREVVTDPLNQHVLDPACGSGTFVAEAVAHFNEAAAKSSLDPKEALDRLRFSVSGIDVHPVAVHLARAAWVLAAQPTIQAAVDYGLAANITAPIYLGDALQLRFRTGDMFAQHNVTVQVEDEQNTELVFPVSLVERAETFDALMGDVAEAIENDDDPHFALDDHHINDPAERQTLEKTIASLQMLHGEGRNHIWAYYTRNLVRPVALSRSKVDVIVGNPPVAELPQHRQYPAHGVGTAEQGPLRHMGRRPVRQPPGRCRPVLCALYRPLSEGRRRHRNGDAPQRPADGPAFQVAHGNGRRNPAAGEGTVRRAVSWRSTSVIRPPGTSRGWSPTPSFPFQRRQCLPGEPAKTVRPCPGRRGGTLAGQAGRKRRQADRGSP